MKTTVHTMLPFVFKGNECNGECLLVVQVSFRGDKNVLESGNGDDCTSGEYTKMHWIVKF